MFDVEGLLRDGSEHQWVMWRAYYMVEPWGDEFMQVAMQMSAQAENFNELDALPIPEEIRNIKKLRKLRGAKVNEAAIAGVMQ